MNRHRRRAQAKLGRTATGAHGNLAPDKISPVSAELLQLGLDHHKGGRLTEAEASYRRALVDRPDHVFTRYILGVLLYDQGKIDEAIAAYQEAIRINPRYEPAFHTACSLRFVPCADGIDGCGSIRNTLAIARSRAELDARSGLAA